MRSPDLSVEIAGVRFPNPILPASGTFGFGEEFSEIYDLNVLGGIVTKSLRFNYFPGNPQPRIYETPCGLLNSIGIPSDGYEYFKIHHLPFLNKLSIPKVISIAGNSIDDYVMLIEHLNKDDGIDVIELNVSCPNLEKEGKTFDSDKEVLIDVVRKVLSESSYPVFVKLSPNANIIDNAVLVEELGADGVVIANTLLGMAIDIEKKIPVFKNIFAGFSGPCVKPQILRLVWQVADRVNIPIIASGGITNFKDAIEFLLAGATLLEVGTANFFNLYTMPEIIKGIEDYLIRNNISEIGKIIGFARKENIL